MSKSLRIHILVSLIELIRENDTKVSEYDEIRDTGRLYICERDVR